jgi:hypothetical protein
MSQHPRPVHPNLAVTAWHGGGTSGYVIGAMFLALGSGRLYLLMRRR